MSRDWSTAREFGRSMQGVHLLQEAVPDKLSGEDILFLLNVNEVPADAQPKKVTVSGLSSSLIPYIAVASGSAVGVNGSVQFNNEGSLSSSDNLLFTGSGLYASGVKSPSYTTNLSSINSVSTSGYILQPTDDGRTILFTSQDPTAVQIPSGLSPGFNCTLIQSTVSGQLTLTSGTGVGFNSAYGANKTTTRYSVAGLIGVAANSYIFTGDITI